MYTNTTFVDAYRGAGRPEATYVIERSMDLVADELGIDPAEVRRRNFLPPDSFPYDNPSGLLTAVNGSKIFIDSGNYEPAMDKALAMAGYGDLAAKKAEAKGRGKLLGLGLSTYIEVCGVAPSKWIGAVGEGWGAAMWESSNIRVHLTGKVVVTMGTQPQGQGHETTYAQIISHELGIPMEDIVVQHSRHPGHAVRLRLVRLPDVERGHGRRAQGRRQDPREGEAATRPTCSRPSPRTSRSRAPSTASRARPTRRRRSRRSRSRSTWRSTRPRAWSRISTRRPTTTRPNCTFPFGTHIAIVEVDEETGHIDLVRYVAVDDVGKKINPMIVDGQLHGGIAQGVGQALWEEAVYDDDGQLLSGSMLDYALPRASWLPAFELDETVTPSARSTRSASRASARPAASPRPRPSRTPSSTRSARSASGTSTCRSRRRRCGAPCRDPTAARREARRDPGGVLVHPGRPASTRRCACSPPTTGRRSSPAARACCR